MAQFRPDQKPPPQAPKTPRQSGSWLRLALLAGLSLYLVVLTAPLVSKLGGPARVDLSYSQLVTQVEEGNVADITIQGQSAQGDLKAAFANNGVTNTQFTATVPDNVGLTDPTFFPLLKSNQVATSVKQDNGGLGSLLLSFLPFLALIAIWIWFVRRSGQAAQGIFSFGRSRARLQDPSTPKTTFHDVAGVEQAQFELQEMVDFLRDPGKFSKLGGRMPKGVLLVGPPGTGKTLLARAVAGEANVPFFSINGSEFVEMFVGVGAGRGRDLFEQARQKAPGIIFIAELDALGRARGSYPWGGGHDEKEQTPNQLLSELDGFDSRIGMILLAATNRPEILDPALLRAGRFDRQVLVDRPEKAGRVQILQVHTRKIQMSPEVDLETVASLTVGFTGADLANLVNEAALLATRRGAEAVTLADFTSAVERIVAGLEKRNRLLNPHEREVVAHHEMGHTLVALSIPGSDKVHKVSIIPRGIGSLGYTIQRPTEDRFLMTRAELDNKMAVLLGGRAAEHIIFGELSTGAADDLVKVTDIARSIVTRYGMSEELGLVSYEKNQRNFLGDMPSAPPYTERSYSEATAREIDSTVKSIVDQAFRRT